MHGGAILLSCRVCAGLNSPPELMVSSISSQAPCAHFANMTTVTAACPSGFFFGIWAIFAYVAYVAYIAYEGLHGAHGVHVFLQGETPRCLALWVHTRSAMPRLPSSNLERSATRWRLG